MHKKVRRMELYVLCRSKLYLCHGILGDEEQENIINKFCKVVNVIAFDPINNVTNQVRAFSPGDMTDELHILLITALPKDESNVLDLVDPEFDSHIFEVTHIPLETSKLVVELFRNMKSHIDTMTSPNPHANKSRDWFFKKKKSRDWSNLLPELLESVVQKLSCFDIIRFKHVCHAWKFAAQSMSVVVPTSSNSHPPLLMLTTSDGKGCCFFNIVTRKIHREFNNMWRGNENINVIGSPSKGWLTLLVLKESKSYLYIFNPFALQVRKIIIPSNAPLDIKIDDTILEVFLTLDPLNHGDKFVVVMQYKRQRYAILTQHDQNPENNEWFSRSFRYPCLDARCCKHWMFTLQWPRVIAWRVTCVNSKGRFRKKRTAKIDASSTKLQEALILGDNGYKVKYYILYSNDDRTTLFVMRIMDHGAAAAAAIPQTKSFVVFKLSDTLDRWFTLDSLGDHVLFIGSGECLYLSNLDIDQVCEKNSIYFADSDFGGDIGVFSLENGSIKRFLPDEVNTKNIQRAVWY